MSKSNEEFVKYMKENPELIAIALTTVQGGKWSTDRWIRNFASVRHGVDMKDTFSHTGLAFADDGGVAFVHQTFPTVAYEQWNPRGFNRMYLINADKNDIYKVRSLRMFRDQRGYGVLQLLSKMLTSMSFGLIPAPVKKGQDCSEFVVRATREMWINHKIDPNDTDPTQLDIFLNQLARTTDWVNVKEIEN